MTIKGPRIKDVAKLAGVSPTTVSFVINDVDVPIPQDTKDRVWEAVKELGYRPNIIAKNLRTKRSRTLGFITDEIATTPFAVDIIRGAQDAVLANYMVLLLLGTEGDPEAEKAAFRLMVEWQVEGILYTALYHRSVNPTVEFKQIPTILVDCYAQDESLPSVVPDEVQGGQIATEALLRKGHKRIGFINGLEHFPAAVGRLRGYQQALTNFGIPFDETLVRNGDWWQESGYERTKELMQLPDAPTAIFCANDFMAMGAYDALKELNCRIPKDISVIGFDNREVIAAHLRPPLTTIALPYYEMGKWAVEFFIEHAGNEKAYHPIQHKIQCPIIERLSI